MKKIKLSLLAICTLLGLSATALNLTNSNNYCDFEESAVDVKCGDGITFTKGLAMGEGGDIDVSRIFYQTATLNNQYHIRFATAIKGDVKQISYSRAAVLEKEEITKNVTTVYKTIKTNETNYYYDGTNLTTDSQYADKYYWACYTISIAEDSLTKYEVANLGITINVDGTTKKRTISIGEMISMDNELLYKFGAPSSSYLTLASVVDDSDPTWKTYGFDTNTRGYIYEAEDAKLSSKINIETNNNQYLKPSGNQNIGNFEIGETITFKVNSTVETEVLLSMAAGWFQSSSPKSNLDEKVFIHYGTDEASLTNKVDTKGRVVPEQNSWNVFRNNILGEVQLKKGINYIRFTSNDAMNIDYISLSSERKIHDVDLVTKYGDLESRELPLKHFGSYTYSNSENNNAVLYEAEDAEVFIALESDRGNEIEINANRSGGKSVGYFGKGSTLTYNIYSNEAKRVQMRLSGARGSSADLVVNELFSVTLNENEVEIPNENVFNCIGGWDYFREFDVAELDLVKGNNKIVITTSGDTNVDYMVLSELNQDDGTEQEFDYVGKYKRFEVEHAELSSEIHIENENTTIGWTNTGSTITFNINSTIAGKTRMYLNGVKGNGESSISIPDLLSITNNDNEVETPNDKSFTAVNNGNYWGVVNFKEFYVADIDLVKGNNKIVLTLKTGVNLDYMLLNDTLITAQANQFENSEGLKIEAEIAERNSGFVSVGNDASASGGKNISSFYGASKITFKIECDYESSYLLTAAVTNNYNATYYLEQFYRVTYGNDLNNLTELDLGLRKDYAHSGWSDYRNNMFGELYLHSGTNYICIESDQNMQSNIDYICLVKPLSTI